MKYVAVLIIIAVTILAFVGAIIGCSKKSEVRRGDEVGDFVKTCNSSYTAENLINCINNAITGGRTSNVVIVNPFYIDISLLVSRVRILDGDARYQYSALSFLVNKYFPNATAIYIDGRRFPY